MSGPKRCESCGHVIRNGHHGQFGPSEFMALGVVNWPEPQPISPELAEAQRAVEEAEAAWREAEAEHLEALNLFHRLGHRRSAAEPAATPAQLQEANRLVAVAARRRAQEDERLRAARTHSNAVGRRVSLERMRAEYEATRRKADQADAEAAEAEAVRLSPRLAALRKKTKR